jgi:hypothetical protein
VSEDSPPSERPLSATVGRTDTYRVEAHNRADPSGTGGADAPGRRTFDFRLTRTDRTPSVDATAVDLLAAHLGSVAHAVTDPLGVRPRVARVTVEGAVAAAGEGRSFGSAVVSIHATLLVESPADDASIERWRRTLRDHETTQRAVPTDVPLSVSVARVSGSRPTA